jgi:CheY-like chemotaxis protein
MNDTPVLPGAAEKAPGSHSQKTILLAEDDAQVQKFVTVLLRRFGYKVIPASDGKEALQKSRDYGATIDLLLSDVEMPGMTGIELAIQLNRERPNMKILLTSGADLGILAKNNGWSFLPKPIVSDMLRDRIRDSLAE